jgi:hypothetical protein
MTSLSLLTVGEVPGNQFVNPADWVFGGMDHHMAKIEFGIQSVQFGDTW